MRAKKILKEIAGWLMPVVIALLLALFLTQVIFINAQVPTGSMEPTIQPRDRVLGLRTSYWFSTPQRGDVVIFHFPDNEKEYYVKRVIGLPGDVVEIIEGKVYINGNNRSLDEPYLAEPPVGSFGPYVVPESCYFVLGDNRNHSSDSRFWVNTFVRQDQIIGQAWVRVFPNPKRIE